MKRILISILALIVFTSSAFASTSNATDLGKVIREDKVVASAYCYPSGNVVLILNGTTIVMDTADIYSLNRIFQTFLDVAEAVESENITVKYHRHIGRMWAGQHSLWGQVNCNYDNSIARVTLNGSITQAASYESTRYTLTVEEVKQIQGMLLDAQTQSRRMLAEIAMLDNIIDPK